MWHVACCREAVARRPAEIEKFAEIFETKRNHVTYDGSVSGPSGTGSFTYDAAIGMMDNFVWDFGGGKTGGIIESALDDSFFPGSGESIGMWIFEALTTVDINIGLTAVYGSPVGAVNFHQTSSDTSGEYVFFLDDLSVYKGIASISVVTDAPTDPINVPEPSVLVLLGTGLLALATRRRNA
jgi:hypothetical protein